MNKKVKLHFKYTLEFEGDKYLSGQNYLLDLPQHKIDSLCRRGCIYAPEDAKYNQGKKEEKKIIEKVAKKKVAKKSEEKVSENVIDKNLKQAKVQAKSTDK